MRVLSEGREKPGIEWRGIGWALGLAFVLFAVTVVTYWIVGPR